MFRDRNDRKAAAQFPERSGNCAAFLCNRKFRGIPCYIKRLSTIASRDWIEDNTKVTIPANKRNYRKQEVHLARARAVQDVDYPNHEWAGRPNAEQTVREWQESHPAGKKADCIRETGLSKPTVYKWWKSMENCAIIKKIFLRRKLL